MPPQSRPESTYIFIETMYGPQINIQCGYRSPDELMQITKHALKTTNHHGLFNLPNINNLLLKLVVPRRLLLSHLAFKLERLAQITLAQEGRKNLPNLPISPLLRILPKSLQHPTQRKLLNPMRNTNMWKLKISCEKYSR